jgi:hypothetical protein
MRCASQACSSAWAWASLAFKLVLAGLELAVEFVEGREEKEVEPRDVRGPMSREVQ